MSHFYAYVALQLATDRVREFEDARRAAQFRAGQPARPSWLRLGLAHGLAAVSRGSAAAVRRLDDCVADDLSRSLAPTE